MAEKTVMKEIVQDTEGSPDVLELRELIVRPPGPVLQLTGGGVHVRACRNSARRHHRPDCSLVPKVRPKLRR